MNSDGCIGHHLGLLAKSDKRGPLPASRKDTGNLHNGISHFKSDILMHSDTFRIGGMVFKGVSDLIFGQWNYSFCMEGEKTNLYRFQNQTEN